MAQANQTKFATAVSEIGRNVVEHAGSGSIRYSLADEGAAVADDLASQAPMPGRIDAVER